MPNKLKAGVLGVSQFKMIVAIKLKNSLKNLLQHQNDDKRVN
jgi:hypothetical protein